MLREVREIDDSDEDEFKRRLLTLEETNRILERCLGEAPNLLKSNDVEDGTKEESNEVSLVDIFRRRMLTPEERDAFLKECGIEFERKQVRIVRSNVENQSSQLNDVRKTKGLRNLSLTEVGINGLRCPLTETLYSKLVQRNPFVEELPNHD
ncbi:MAG: hypothetical protein P1Q69_04605 [Candidatus Thorarchaeota archaeon]|nr:hypothetical protein [Candidatus Thorarchaeota archaeon]